MGRRWVWAGVVFLGVALALGVSDRDRSKTLTIGLTPWSSTTPSAYVAKVLLEERGYQVSFLEADVGVIFAGLARGDVDLFTDAWLPTLHKSYMERYGDRVEVVGTVYRQADLGWVVPGYVPVNSLAELAGQEAAFDLDGDGRGEIVGIDPGAGMMAVSREVLATYGLDGYELVEGSEFAMLTELSRALKREGWICVLAWSPHWIFAAYDLKYLEDPKGLWQKDDVRVLTRRGLAEEAPQAVALLRDFQISIDDMNRMILAIEVEDQDPEEVARAWVEAHRPEVDRWGRRWAKPPEGSLARPLRPARGPGVPPFRGLWTVWPSSGRAGRGGWPGGRWPALPRSRDPPPPG